MVEAKKYTIGGALKDQEGLVLSGLAVQAFIDTTKTEPQFIGQAVTEENGNYQIEYDDAKLKELKITGESRIIIQVRTMDDRLLERETRKRPKSGSQTININNINYVRLGPGQLSRLETIKDLVGDQQLKTKVDVAFKMSNGDWKATLDSLKKDNLPSKSLADLEFAHSLAEITGDKSLVAVELAKDSEKLREVALKFDPDLLNTVVIDNQIDLGPIEGDIDEEKEKNYQDKAHNYVASLNRKLYLAEPSGTLQRMVAADQLPIADVKLHKSIAKIFDNQPDFDISKTSVYELLAERNAFKDIPEDQIEGVTRHMKILQRIQAISPVPEAIPQLMEANLTSAYQVAELPEKVFMRVYGERLGETTARQVYNNAVSNRVRNEHALMAMKEAVQGSGVAFIDGDDGSAETRRIKLQRFADDKQVPLNWENLFGSADFCECEECNSVYSPAAYFVELLQYLRNNNLDPTRPNTGKEGIAGTPLEKLFRRRPDLGCLELTCQNAFTVLPYIDLVNEVMESFVLHLGEYHADVNDPKQAILETFDVEDELSSELMAQPEHTNYAAYCILKHAKYPFTLPYHQPIDAIRIFLNYLETSRYELMKTFRAVTVSNQGSDDDKMPADDESGEGSTDAELAKLAALQDDALDRAIDAEYLGLTQEEYIILTKEAFCQKEYFDIKLKKNLTEEEYQQKIGVEPVHIYYGYGNEADMLNPDETEQTGLTFVKKQFLKRTGLEYTDLVDLLKTQCINPNLPQGQALTILESIQFSYRFLQTLVVTGSTDPRIRFGKLIDFLEKTQPFLPLVDALLNPDPCEQQKPAWNLKTENLRAWVYCYFEKVGELIVLESGDGPILPIEGDIYTDGPVDRRLIGRLSRCGVITDPAGDEIGKVDMSGQVLHVSGRPFLEEMNASYLVIVDDQDVRIGLITSQGIFEWHGERINWLPTQDTCDLDRVRLKHLDGTDLTVDEYDRSHRFIRLWRKLGWTIDEVDKALVGLAAQAPDADSEMLKEDELCLDAFEDIRECEEQDDDFDCPPVESVEQCKMTPSSLHHLVAVKQLLGETGLPIPKLLSFWTNISTVGEKSLYESLFLKHNLLGIDQVFEADVHGNYLTGDAKISEHIPVLMAAFNLKAEDIASIVDFMQLRDELSLANVSVLYRVSLLARILHVRIPDFAEIIELLGDPFETAHETLGFLERWGKMEDAGFRFWQLNYIVRDHDDTQRPLTPTLKSLLQLAITLYDGLNAIDEAHPDISDDEVNSDIIRAQASVLFEPPVVEQIISLLEGTTVYRTNAPSGLEIDSSSLSNSRLEYDSQNGAIRVTGILSEEEKTQHKALSNHPEWPTAIDRVSRQPVTFFTDVLYAVFKDNYDEAKTALLQGDVDIPPDQQDPNNPIPSTVPMKQVFFWKTFLPFLRQRLTHRFLVDTLSDSSGLSNEATDILISEVLEDSGRPLIELFSAIKSQRPQGENGWNGYLIPAAEDDYTFVIESETRPGPLRIDGQAVNLRQQDDPTNVWLGDPIWLKSRQSYRFEITGLSSDLEKLTWKTPTSPRAAIPSSVLLPDYSAQSMAGAFKKLQKAALLVNGFNLNEEEIEYFSKHATDFGGLDFNAVTLDHWLRLQAYTELRDSLPTTETNLIGFFNWAHNPDDEARLTQEIEALALWEEERIKKLITAEHFNLDRPDAFLNEKHLLKMQKALQVADKIGMDINLLFDWARPRSKFWASHQIAESIRKAIRSRYLQEDWEQVVKPLNDELRENQKQALISYLLVQKDLVDWGVIDTDSLFEFFLIDVQMQSCMETSRIKQAISSVQLFVQRCFLGLEEDYGIPKNALIRERWGWMQRYRVWEANRKVFLYPENWIEPNLRDDKSPFFSELESELLQKDINRQTVEDALKSYLYKVDEVANMQVVGLYYDRLLDENGNEAPGSKIHVFARTRNAPYSFFYRCFKTVNRHWLPWEKIQVDIPSYDLTESEARILGNGTYLIPAVWNNRLLIFFPQFLKKISPKQFNDSLMKMGEEHPETSKPNEFWEIKMAWSEYRNGKWAQKQVSAEAHYHGPLDYLGTLPEIDSYQFVPMIMQTNIRILVLYRHGTQTGHFEFDGTTIKKEGLISAFSNDDLPDRFHYKNSFIHSLQRSSDGIFSYLTTPPYSDDQSNGPIFERNGSSIKFYHPFSHSLLGHLTSGNLNTFFAFDQSEEVRNDAAEFFGEDESGSFHELKRAYSLYNWELFFHLPTMLADNLSKSRQFEDAMKWYHYVFNPFAEGDDGHRFWQFQPFRLIDADSFLQTLFNSLQPNQSHQKIASWRDNPFNPHHVARDRPVAYMKWVVMKYLDNLIAWADYLFRQFTIETINQATQLYILAGHILGPEPQIIPKRGKVKPQSYNSLLDQWDAFSNAMVELELAFPSSNQTPLPVGISNGEVGFANIFGFASSLYFCLPNNPKLMGYWKTIKNRLDNIRNCRDIEGVFRIPALFEPPIDPALLVQATAQGLNLSSVLNDLNSPMPNYRFNYLVQKALEMCNELKSLGNAFLSALEKKDAEVLSKMRARHDSSIQNLVMEVRKQQLEEAKKSLDALYQNRKSPEYRLRHFLELIGEDLNNVPSEDADFAELPNQMEQVIDESGLKLIPFEKEEIEKANNAADWQIWIGVQESLASLLHAIPDIGGAAKPWGIGTEIKFGGSNLGYAAQGQARGMQTYASNLTYQSSSAARKGGFLRQLQDRVQQANLAGLEIKQIDKQIVSQKIRINIAEQEITNQQKQIDNAQEVEEYLKSKYTNEELYLWMEGAIRTLYYQTYTLAYDLAKRTEQVYRFERGLSSSNYIQFGYWDSTRDGLLAGERLYVGLKQLEAAFQEKRGHDYEITKNISLRQINPFALIELRETGKCEFVLPEVLFDMDFPGHYKRRIKAVGVSIPCVVGPYTSVNCTARLLENKFRINAIASDTSDYRERTDGSDERFATMNIPITSIAVSSGQNDSGVFELNFRDERYMPFEGAGVVSKWRLELSSSFRQFDYDTITDVIMHIRYTAVDGGDKLKQPAEASVQDFIKSVAELSQQEGLFAAFDLKHDFSNEWHSAIGKPPTGNERILRLDNLNERLPVFTKGRDPSEILATDVTLLTSADLQAAALSIKHDGNEYNFVDGASVGENKGFVVRDQQIPVSSWQIEIQDIQKEIDRIWLIARYTLS